MAKKSAIPVAKPRATPAAKPRGVVPGFAALIRSRREALGWSKIDLARAAGVGAMTICNLESEDRSPSLRIAMKIAAALGLTVPLANPTETGI